MNKKTGEALKKRDDIAKRVVETAKSDEKVDWDAIDRQMNEAFQSYKEAMLGKKE